MYDGKKGLTPPFFYDYNYPFQYASFFSQNYYPFGMNSEYAQVPETSIENKDMLLKEQLLVRGSKQEQNSKQNLKQEERVPKYQIDSQAIIMRDQMKKVKGKIRKPKDHECQYIPKFDLSDNKERYLKKNIEANIVYQLFSYLWSQQKGKKQIVKILHNYEKVKVYYQIMKTVKGCCKIYRNKMYSRMVCNFDQKSPRYKKIRQKVLGQSIISRSQFAMCNRIMIRRYLKTEVVAIMLTSRKINKFMWKQHLEYCRDLYGYIFNSFEAKMHQN